MSETKSDKPPGPAIGYVDILDIHLQKKADAEALQPASRFPLRPSSAGKCSRELAYEYAEFRGYFKAENKEAHSPELQRIFSLGHAVEKDIMWHLKGVTDLQLRYPQQTLSFFKLHDGTLIEGNIDSVFYFKEHKAIIDFKSKKDKFSAFYASKWDEDSAKYGKMESVEQLTDTTFFVRDLAAFLNELNDPFFEANFLQLNLYACNPFIRERGIDHAAIIQINKNDSRMREVRFIPSDEVFNWVKEKFEVVAATVDETKDPTSVHKDYVLGNVKCAFCPFKDTCWPYEEPTKEFFKTLPPKPGGWPKDTDRLGEDGEALENLFVALNECLTKEAESGRLETEILEIMEEHKLRKIRLKSGEVYEAKRLKDRIDLRRSK